MTLRTLPLRLPPGADLRAALEQAVADGRIGAGFVLSGIGSLSGARLRAAGALTEISVLGDVELLSLSGSVSADGAHLHAVVADVQGQVRGGHLQHGNIVRTTAEVLLAELPDWELSRAPDAQTGYLELVVRPRP